MVPTGLKTLSVNEIRESLASLRIARPAAELWMQRSLRTRGQLSPVTVWQVEGSHEMVDGFKRLRAARLERSLSGLTAQVMIGSATDVKRAMLVLNDPGGGVSPIEEAWVIRSLIHDEHHSQVEVAALMGKHQSWVSRRLALVQRLDSSVQQDVRIGLLAPRLARAVALMPRGIQRTLVEAIHRQGLSGREVETLAGLLRQTPPHLHPELLSQTREALRRRGAASSSIDPDPRLRSEVRQILAVIGLLSSRSTDLAHSLAVADTANWVSRERQVVTQNLRTLYPRLKTLLEVVHRVIVPAGAVETVEVSGGAAGPLEPISRTS
jgi:ParB/RepB/Spo0J family partition protein